MFNYRLALFCGIGLSALAAAGGACAQAASSAQDGPAVVGEVIVTANRREETLSKVAISAAAYSQDALNQKGVKSIDDITRITPNVQFRRDYFGAGERVIIAIRGIVSEVGVPTTGLYIDDTPIQVRGAGQSQQVGLPFPAIFDLERVEVLRGPQGTLFGAGSEGGAVRFISPKPSLTDYSGLVRAEGAATQGGAASGELGLAVGGPIVQDKLGFRLSAWTRRDGGYVDRVDYFTGQVQKKNENYGDASSFKAALAWAPTSNLLITPSLIYQKTYSNGPSTFWKELSDPSEDRYVTANAAKSTGHDRFFLPALSVKLDLGGAQLYSNTSYFDRKNRNDADYTQYDIGLFGVYYQPFPLAPSGSTVNGRVKTFTQEVRLQSSGETRLTWVAGAFYSRSKQFEGQLAEVGGNDPFFQALFGTDLAGFFGAEPYLGLYSYFQRLSTIDKQVAVFGQIDYKLTDRLKLTLGGRYADTQFSFTAEDGGPFAAPGSVSAGSQKERPFTPKAGLTFQADDNNMLYAIASKGFRQGGSQSPVPYGVCSVDLDALGLSQSPTEYNSDHVWSYEAGSKNKFLGGRVAVDASVFHIDWSNIQTRVYLSTCGQQYIANLGSAKSQGGDVSIRVAATNRLTFDLAVGYTDATYSKTIASGPAVLVEKGDRLVRSPWSASAAVNYKFYLGETPGFARLDYQYNAKTKDQNPAVYAYDPDIPNPPRVDVANARAGLGLSDWDVEVFVNNLTNTHAVATSHDFLGSPLYLGNALRPRTFGVAIGRKF